MRGGRLVREVLSSPALRRLQAAALIGILSGTAYAVALYVYAFRQGGTTAVGLVGLLVMVPAGVLAPAAALAADRGDRATVIAAALLLRAACLCAAAATIRLGGPAGVVYALAVVASMFARVVYPAQAALLPDVAPTTETLAAANVVASTVESLGSVLGPALGGALVALWAPDAAFLVCGLPLLAGAACVWPLRGTATPTQSSSSAFWREATAGVVAIARSGPMRLLVGSFALQTVTFGVFTVLTVAVAIDLVHGGNGAVGVINACFGAGGVAGGAALLALGRRELGLQTALGLALWGVPLMLMAAWPWLVAIAAFAAVIGLGNTLLDAGVFTLLQGLAPKEVRGRVFGAIEGIAVATVGIGAVLAPVLVHWLGLRGALVAAGVPLPLLAVATLRPLRTLDSAPEGLLRAPFARLLSPEGQSRLEQATQKVSLPADATVFRQGEAGDDLYVIDSGEVAITIDGNPVAKLGPGDFFGEIALLAGSPRSGTAITTAETTLLRVAGGTFVDVVRGDRATRTSVGAVAATRLARIA